MNLLKALAIVTILLTAGCATTNPPPAPIQGAELHEAGDIVTIMAFCKEGPALEAVKQSQRDNDEDKFAAAFGEGTKCYHTPSLGLPFATGPYVRPLYNGCHHLGIQLIYFVFQSYGEEFVTWVPTGNDCGGRPLPPPDAKVNPAKGQEI